MSRLPRRLLMILEKWPVEKTKLGRDLGEHIRSHVVKQKSITDLNNKSSAELSKQIDCLERLSRNVHLKTYQRRHGSTATGLTALQCSQVLSSEFLRYLNDGDDIQQS